ncbi:MAG: hypothetical protein LBB11_02150 [Puniceicoccales bacterium]|jgi:tetratricopeptide (TPR) repeat protein|nr:hypothetical protein [Puniceicoccales bacterium]
MIAFVDMLWHQRWVAKVDSLCQAKNWKYAQFLCLEMLYDHPNAVDIRRILQRVRQHTFCKSKLRRWLLLSMISCRFLWYLWKIKTKYREFLNTLEALLNIDPYNGFLLRLSAEIMAGFGFWETVIFAIDCIPENERNDDDWLTMGEAFSALGDFQMAIDIANKVLVQSTDNIRARDLLWQSSVEQSMENKNDQGHAPL